MTPTIQATRRKSGKLAHGVFLLAAVATSCTATRTAHEISQAYAPPKKPEVENSKTFKGASFDETWEAIISFFATRQISIETLEKESGIVVAKKMLTSGSDGDGIVRLGDVTTTRQILKQWLKPSQFAGSANPGVVRATGTVTKQEAVAGSVVKTVAPAACRSSVSFNVFVSRFAEEEMKVTINVDVSTVDAMELYSAWVWRDYLEGAPLATTPQLISLVRSHVAPNVVNPEPVTTGALEQVFLDHLAQALGGA